MKGKLGHYIRNHNIVNGILHNRNHRVVLAAAASFALNVGYAIYNGVLGLLYGSLWFLSLCAYYIILSVMRFAAVSYGRKNRLKGERQSEVFVMRFTGVMLMLLSLVLSASVSYSLSHEVEKANGTIVMITIATYTFYKVILAFVNAVKTAKHHVPLLTTIRNISCADAAASVLSLQRSMLVSFEGKSLSGIKRMNTVTGIFVCLFVFGLGLIMTIGILGGKRNGKIKNCKSK